MNLRFGQIVISIKSGALIPLLLMLPNVLWMLFFNEGGDQQATAVPIVLTIIENIGRAGILLLPFFYSLDLNRDYALPVINVMGIMLIIYYSSWVRYFMSGGISELLRAPFLGIPLPMALAPAIFLILSSYLMHSWLMLGVSILFGIAHIWVSALSL